MTEISSLKLPNSFYVTVDVPLICDASKFAEVQHYCHQFHVINEESRDIWERR